MTHLFHFVFNAALFPHALLSLLVWCVLKQMCQSHSKQEFFWKGGKRTPKQQTVFAGFFLPSSSSHPVRLLIRLPLCPGSYTSSFSNDLVRKPSRLEALPTMDRKNNVKKKSVPMLNTMGTFWFALHLNCGKEKITPKIMKQWELTFLKFKLNYQKRKLIKDQIRNILKRK